MLEEDKFDEEPNPLSLPNLILGLGLCILCGARGAHLVGPWRSIWLCVGLFGITAAVGLGAIEMCRLALMDRERRRRQQQQESALLRFAGPETNDSSLV